MTLAGASRKNFFKGDVVGPRLCALQRGKADMVDPPRLGEPFGGYRIVRRIGFGGMGTVFEAVQENLARSVALKVLLPQYSDEEEFRSRFTREARALAALDSPHVIQVHDYGEVSGQLFIATQLINGPDLQRRLSDTGTPPVDTALDVAAQVASGLADAHAAGVLHRDIKPSNVLVREGHGEIHAYLCDFGIARAEDDDHALTTGVAGTVGYMAPERHQGDSASVQSDIYSLGCLLWVLVSGDVPYAGTSGVQTALAHMHQPIPQLAGADTATTAINAILRRAMDKQPGHRYVSAVEMRRDLLAAVTTVRAAETRGAGATTLRPLAHATELRGAVPVAPAPQSGRPRRRGRGLALVAGVALVAAISAAGVALAGGDEEPDEVAPSDAAQREAGSSGPVATIECWDGATAASREECGLPSGAAGLQTVFPSMNGCDPTASRVAGKAEVYVCRYGDFLIRYSRWDQGYDRYAYLDAANQVDSARWSASGEVAGRQWKNYEDDAAEQEPYQWSASYRSYPYSVSVEGVSPDARRRGMDMVDVAAPSQIGLR